MLQDTVRAEALSIPWSRRVPPFEASHDFGSIIRPRKSYFPEAGVRGDRMIALVREDHVLFALRVFERELRLRCGSLLRLLPQFAIAAACGR